MTSEQARAFLEGQLESNPNQVTFSRKKAYALVKEKYPECKVYRSAQDFELLSRPKKGLLLAKHAKLSKLYIAAALNLKLAEEIQKRLN